MTHVVIAPKVLVIVPLDCSKFTEINFKPLSSWSVIVNHEKGVSSGISTRTRKTRFSPTATLVHAVMVWSVDCNVLVIVGEKEKVVDKEADHVYERSSLKDQARVLHVQVTTLVIPVLYATPVITFVWKSTCENSPGKSTG